MFCQFNTQSKQTIKQFRVTEHNNLSFLPAILWTVKWKVSELSQPIPGHKAGRGQAPSTTLHKSSRNGVGATRVNGEPITIQFCLIKDAKTRAGGLRLPPRVLLWQFSVTLETPITNTRLLPEVFHFALYFYPNPSSTHSAPKG